MLCNPLDIDIHGAKHFATQFTAIYSCDKHYTILWVHSPEVELVKYPQTHPQIPKIPFGWSINSEF